jgi:hypothetical protein
MDESIQDLLNKLPAKAPRSKLEPHRTLIFELLAKWWTYRDIAALFSDQLKISVAPSTLHNFVKVRAKGKAVTQVTSPARRKEITGERNRHSGVAAKFEFTPGETLRLSPKERDKK